MVYIITHNNFLSAGFIGLLQNITIVRINSDLPVDTFCDLLGENDSVIIDVTQQSQTYDRFNCILHGSNPRVIYYCDNQSEKIFRAAGVKYLINADSSPLELRLSIENIMSAKNTNHDNKITLSIQELSIMRMSINGLSPMAISVLFGLSIKTVYSYRRNACEKLGVRKVTDLIPFFNILA